MRILIACDHGAFALKAEIIQHLQQQPGYQVINLGVDGPQSVDYPEYAQNCVGLSWRGRRIGVFYFVEQDWVCPFLPTGLPVFGRLFVMMNILPVFHGNTIMPMY